MWKILEEKMNFFELTKTDYDYIVEQCMLDKEYQKLLEYKIKGYSIVKISQLLKVSEATVSVMTKKLKKKIKKII
jgi:transcriptional regulator